MPVSKQSAITYTIHKISVDMVAGNMWVYFRRVVDTIEDGGVEMNVEGSDLVSLLSTQATSAQPLADEITLAIYNYAVAKGVITGAIS